MLERKKTQYRIGHRNDAFISEAPILDMFIDKNFSNQIKSDNRRIIFRPIQ